MMNARRQTPGCRRHTAPWCYRDNAHLCDCPLLQYRACHTYVNVCSAVLTLFQIILPFLMLCIPPHSHRSCRRIDWTNFLSVRYLLAPRQVLTSRQWIRIRSQQGVWLDQGARAASTQGNWAIRGSKEGLYFERLVQGVFQKGVCCLKAHYVKLMYSLA